MDIFTEICNRYASFTHKERCIADYILREGDRLQNINISVLAAHVGVSPGTITRFCRKIEYPSFADLKVQLSRSYSGTATPDNDVPAKVYTFYKTVVERSNQLIDSQLLLRFAKEIREANHLYIYGVGNSGLSATEFMMRLTRMGLNVHSITDSHLMLINSSIVGENDVILAISISGETADLVSAVRVAKEGGCRVLALTSAPESSLVSYSDICFPVINPKLVGYDQVMNSQFPVQYVIDLVTTVLLQEEDLYDKVEITVSTISKHSHLK